VKQLWQKTLSYLGMGEEDQFADYDDYDDDRGAYPESSSTVRKITRLPDMQRAEKAAPRRQQPQEGKMDLLKPVTFADAQVIADKLKNRSSVVANFSSCDKALSQRLLDFSCGVTYGLNGAIHRLGDRTYLLTPSNVAVSAEDRRKLREYGYSFGDPG